MGFLWERLTTPEIAGVLTRRCYFNTFGGNAVATTAGLAVLNVIEKEKLQENASMVGSYLKGKLSQLKEKHESKSLSPSLPLSLSPLSMCPLKLCS